MLLRVEQLEAALKKSLAPVYFISGDEPMQLGEAADSIRQAAKLAGFENREILTVDKSFSWSELALAADSLSLFEDKKIIDLRLPSGKPGKDGGKALLEYCQRISTDNLLLISAGKIEAASKKSRWFEALDKAGVVVQVWPQAGKELIGWLRRRLQKKGLQLEESSIKLLAQQTEGNLLAAVQEIEKLFVLYGGGQLSHAQVANAVVDNSRYDVFTLADSLLNGKIGRCLRILNGLRGEGVATPVILWVISKEARLLIDLQDKLAQGKQLDSLLQKDFFLKKRKTIINAALTRLSKHDLERLLLLCAKADRQIKGEQRGDVWDTLSQICMEFCGVAVLSRQ